MTSVKFCVDIALKKAVFIQVFINSIIKRYIKLHEIN